MIEKVKVHTITNDVPRFMQIIVSEDAPTRKLAFIRIDDQLHRINHIYRKPVTNGICLEIECTPMSADTVDLV